MLIGFQGNASSEQWSIETLAPLGEARVKGMAKFVFGEGARLAAVDLRFDAHHWTGALDELARALQVHAAGTADSA